ncbi:type I-C CRISPR-associated protein Cas5 [bacterium]|nr:type I-C CRISPR-associated protein Cas5 [candidate division CSSED10-310 bacterium]
MRNHHQVLEVWGEFACFSRPELKVERFSYPVITPSAARGIFDAIYFKRTEFRWQICRIEVLTPPVYIALRRNEVKDKITAAVDKWVSGRVNPEPLWADGDKNALGTDQKGRTQRQTMALKNVHYRLHAEIRPWLNETDNVNGIVEQFRRRARRGQCFFQPCFGCREFPAYFRLVEDKEPPPPAAYSQDLGLMLYDVFDLSRPGTSEDKPFISLFHAKVVNGVLDIPSFESTSVLKPEGGGTHA